MIEDGLLHGDIESAYGSDASSESSGIRKRESFSVQEPAVEKHVWRQYLKHKLRDYMILETLIFIILLLILINTYRILSQSQETRAVITTLQAQFETFQKQVSGKEIIDSKNESETESQNKEVKRMEDVLNEVMKEVKVKTVQLVENTPKPTIPMQSPVSRAPKSQIIQLNTSFTRLNVASYMLGAVLDKTKSSSSNLYSNGRFDQSNLVLLDRPDPPANRAWCTYEKNPVLTVNLAKYVNLTAISYQHSKWNGTIPDNAPKIYDVVACLDYYCDKWKTIAKNCEYEPDEIGQEQLCNLTLNSINSTIGKVQFRFLRNHGNIEKTCVSLVRVYADSHEGKKPEEETLEKSAKCSNLKNNYHNSSFVYKYFDSKNCNDLYSGGCCTDCPECCQECWIRDFDRDSSSSMIFVSIILLPIVILILIGIVCLIEKLLRMGSTVLRGFLISYRNVLNSVNKN